MVFLNSNFGIWVLTLFVVIFGGYFAEQYLENKRIKSNISKQIDMLDLEIESRFYQLITKQLRASDSLKTYKKDTSSINEVYKNILFEFKSAPISNNNMFSYIFPEFKKRNTTSLIIELYFLIKKQNKTSEQEVKELKSVTKEILSNDFIPLTIKSEDELQKIIKKIKKEMILSRWSKYWLEK